MKYNDEYWTERIDDSVPERVQDAIKRVYNSYPEECMPQGVCDPMYIMNMICLILDVGNGKGEFYLPDE